MDSGHLSSALLSTLQNSTEWCPSAVCSVQRAEGREGGSRIAAAAHCPLSTHFHTAFCTLPSTANTGQCCTTAAHWSQEGQSGQCSTLQHTRLNWTLDSAKSTLAGTAYWHSEPWPQCQFCTTANAPAQAKSTAAQEHNSTVAQEHKSTLQHKSTVAGIGGCSSRSSPLCTQI